MKLLDELRAEHDLIDTVLGSLRTFVLERLDGKADPSHGEAFLRFFRLYADGFHHAREEGDLFAALVTEAGLPGHQGPLPALVCQHRAMAQTLGEMAPLLTLQSFLPAEREALARLAKAFTHALWRHIDAENSVLLPEAETRLRRAGIFELTGRSPAPEELAAAKAGELLAELYPPGYDPDAVRGEGCAICPSYGHTCNGVEREWWNEFEWEEFPDHLG